MPLLVRFNLYLLLFFAISTSYVGCPWRFLHPDHKVGYTDIFNLMDNLSPLLFLHNATKYAVFCCVLLFLYYEQNELSALLNLHKIELKPWLDKICIKW